MEGLEYMEKKAFIGTAMRGALKFFNPFKNKIPLSKVPKRIAMGTAMTLPFSNSSSQIKKTRMMKNVW